MFLRNLDEDQTLIVYVCAGRLCGLGRETEPTVFQPQPSKGSDPLPNAILGSLCAEAGASKLFGQANTIKRNLFGEDDPAENDLFRVTRYISDDEVGRADAGPERDAAIAAAKKLFEGDAAKSRMALFELVDTALTIIIKSGEPPVKLISEPNRILEKGRQENDNIGFVLGFAEEALLPSSMELDDFVSASAELIAASFRVADFVDTGEAPQEWSGFGENGSRVEEAQGQTVNEAVEDDKGGHDNTTTAVEGS